MLLIGGYGMNNFDLTPLFRSTVGFDRFSQLLENMTRVDDGGFSYPPYNIEKMDEDHYRIAMAIADFSENDVQITVKENSLIVVGKLQKTEDSKQYLYRGIAGRSFERRFELADHIYVENARINNGLLHIELVRRIPDSAKPRIIKINTSAQTIQDQARLEDRAA